MSVTVHEALSALAAAAIPFDGFGNMMLNDDEVFRLQRAGKTRNIHEQLDAALPSATAEARRKIAHWRTSTLLYEKRYSEALDHLQQNSCDYNCKTLVHHERASILDLLGRGEDALRELRSAPIAAETERYRALVLDAKFFLLYLMAKNNIAIEQSSLDAIPDDHISILPSETSLYGAHVSKDDLKAMIETGW